jgi:hypothetical protein
MHLLTETHRAVKQNDVVEIKLWEIYLLYHPAQLYKELTDYSTDNGPIEHDHKYGRVIFRFKQQDWENHIKQLLYYYRIPVIVQSNHYDAVKAKGRQAVLR